MALVDRFFKRRIPEGEHRLLSSTRLQSILTIFVAVLLLCMTGLVFALVSRIFNRLTPSIQADLEWKAERGVHELAQSVDVGLAVRDKKLIAEALGDYRKDPDVVAIVVTDPSDVPVVIQGTSSAKVEGAVHGPEGRVQLIDGLLAAWSPVTIEGATVGKVVLAISTQRLKQGADLRRGILLVAGAGFLAALFLSFVFVTVYIAPLVRLADETLKDLATSNVTLEHRVQERTAALEDTNAKLQGSLEELNAAQRQLVDASRRAGMADVATTVLHNVGNVLNSVNVSAGLVIDQVHGSRLESLQKAVNLLREQDSDLGRFFAEDPRGKRLPEYFSRVTETLAGERRQMITELQLLQKNVDHVKTIIGMQQTHAKTVGGLIEELSIEELLEDAIQTNSMSYEKHQVQLVREYQALPRVALDRHKIFQILMNLLSNARHAVKESTGAKRSIVVVRTRRVGEDRFAIEVEDNGYGVLPENLARIFNHGFTTKKEGHGFGLHSAANAAREMGGTLRGRSEGRDRGAIFTLELPLRAQAPA